MRHVVVSVDKEFSGDGLRVATANINIACNTQPKRVQIWTALEGGVRKKNRK